VTDRHPYPPIDATKNQIITFVGRKGSGKSQAAREHFRGWPSADRLVIDINGDADPGADLEPIMLRGRLDDLPRRRDDRRPEVYRWIADPRAKTFHEDVDRVIGAALFPRARPVVVWVDEMGEVFPVGRTGPNGRLLLHQSRHFNVSALLCGPRSKGIDPLVMAQADRLLMFEIPNPLDRARIAENIGVGPTRLAEVLDETATRGEHWSTMYVNSEHALYRLPPFPIT
jgi:hypothetical protein